MTTPCHKYIILVLLFSILSLPACYTLPMAEPAQPTSTKLKMPALPFLGFAPLFIAEEEGYFAEQGLEIDYVKMDAGADAVPALIQGDFDIVAGAINLGLLNGIARGGNIKIVSDLAYMAADGCTSQALLTSRTLLETGELANSDQWRGLRIAVNPTGVQGFYVEKLLNTAGLTLEDVSVEDIPPPVLAEALRTNAVDLVQASEPWITRILQTEQASLWKPAQDVIPDFQFAVILYGPNLLEENPKAGRRFLVAYLKGVRQYNQGKTERNVEIVAKYTGLEPELLQAACWSSKRDDGRINVQSVLDFQKWGVENGLLDQLLTEEQFWDPTFIRNANRTLGTPLE